MYHQVTPRELSNIHFDPLKDIGTVRRTAGQGAWSWEQKRDFPCVPYALCQSPGWHLCFHGVLRFPESIHRLEGRAGFVAVRRPVKNRGSFGKKILLLSDNMSVVCAIAKGRATDPALLSYVPVYCCMEYCKRLCVACPLDSLRVEYRSRFRV